MNGTEGKFPCPECYFYRFFQRQGSESGKRILPGFPQVPGERVRKGKYVICNGI